MTTKSKILILQKQNPKSQHLTFRVLVIMKVMLADYSIECKKNPNMRHTSTSLRVIIQLYRSTICKMSRY